MANTFQDNWEYFTLFFIIGVIIGVVVTLFFTLHHKKTLIKQLDKSKSDLQNHRIELAEHFAESAKLLDNMAEDFRQLYKHISHSSSSLCPETQTYVKLSDNQTQSSSSTAPLPPRDYPAHHIEMIDEQKPKHN